MTKTIISAQNEAIHSLKNAINSFVLRNVMTRIIPLAIPTGWGKTRIALQAVLKAKYKKKKPPSIIIWPQKQSHISEEVWRRCSDWCKKRDRSNCDPTICNRNDMYHLEYLHPSTKGPKKRRFAKGAGSHYSSFPGTFYYVNNKIKGKGLKNELIRSNGPIIFIIDEWYTKKFIESYEEEIINSDNPPCPEEFWRDQLFGNRMKRQLFVILISATPIGVTSYLDKMCFEEEDDKYEEQIKNALQLFNELTLVGNQRRTYNLYNVYPDLIKREEQKLLKYCGKYGFKICTSKKDYIGEYIRISNKCFANKAEMPYPPNLIYPLESIMHSGAIYSHIKSHFSKLKGYFKETFRRQHETLKLKITRDLLNAYPEKKFVIFCHYIAVAHCLCDYLSSRGIKCYYLEGDVGKNDNEFNNFNESKGKTNVLIVTDEHSQGISLHKSEAWLIHFELSWNPIRIIQRYGRVWRINNTTHKLTLPSAFYIPHSFSSEEEQIARLKRRWQVLKNLPNNEKSFVNLAPISFEIALGTRCSPLPYKS